VKHIEREEIDRYMNAAQSAMFQYQLIEEGLKTCISMTHQVIKTAIPSDVSFDYQDSEFDSMPLERLLNVFGRLTKNKALVKQLNGLRESRNYVAHKAFALAFFSSVSEKVDFQKELKKVRAAQEASVKAFMALKDELDRLNAFRIRFIPGKNAA
jgi:hypothetical protein